MKKTVDYLDEIQRIYGLPSDYAISKKLEITRAAVSQYRQGKGYFSDEVAQRAAKLLGKHPGVVMLDMYAERTKDAETRHIWEEVKAGFPALSLLAKSGRSVALPR